MSWLSINLYRSLDLICLKGTGTKLNQHIGLPTWAPNWPNLWFGGTTPTEKFLLDTQQFSIFDSILQSSTKLAIEVEAVYLGRVIGITSGLAASMQHPKSERVPGHWILSTSDLRREFPQLDNASKLQLKQRRSIWAALTPPTWSGLEIDSAAANECFTSLWTPLGRGSIYSTQLIDWIDINAWFRVGRWTLRQWSQLQAPSRSRYEALAMQNEEDVLYEEDILKGPANQWQLFNKALETVLGSGMRLAGVDFSLGPGLGMTGAALVHPHAEVSDEVFYLRGCRSSAVTLRRTGQNATTYSVVAAAYLDWRALGLKHYVNWSRGELDDIDPGRIRVLSLV
jgi:hypothetical protein